MSKTKEISYQEYMQPFIDDLENLKKVTAEATDISEEQKNQLMEILRGVDVELTSALSDFQDAKVVINE